MLVPKSAVLILAASMLLTSAENAAAALVCDATIPDVAFGQVSVRDAGTDTTMSNVSISCSGGAPSSTARACLSLGTGSGGAGSGNSPRYMTGPQAALLEYQVTSGNFFSGGGPIWNDPQFDVPLDANGAGTITPAIYAEITSSGSEIRGGLYGSVFSGSVDVSLSYGELSTCDSSGTVNSFSVGAEVTPSCSITTSAMDFGRIDGNISAPIDQTALIDISCTNATPYSVQLGFGNGSGVSSPAARKMMSGAEGITYGLYLDAARTSAWGSDAANDFEGTGNGGTQQATVFGRIHSPQSVPVGTYTDSVVVTIEY